MLSGGRIEVCYNVQTAVDAKHKLIVADDVTNAAADRDQLSPLATRGPGRSSAAPAPVVVADQGYYHGAEIKACVDAGITPLVPRPLTSANEARGPLHQGRLPLRPRRRMSIAARRARR